MNKPRSIPTTIAEPTFSLCPSACFWSYHPCSHDSLHDPPNIFSPLPSPRAVFLPRLLRSARFHQRSPLRLRSFHPSPLHCPRLRSPSPPRKRCEILLSFSFQTSNLSDFYRTVMEGGEKNPRKISRVYKHGTSRRNPDTSPRLILSRTSSEIYNVGNISILCKSIEVSWVSRVYNRDLVCSIITGHGCKRCFSTMDRKHGFIKLLCRPDQRLTNATCPRHAFNPELGKPGYIHVYIYITKTFHSAT